MIGDSIKDFSIISRLGQGGMGEVFVGEQRMIKTRVAIKTLLPAISQDRELVKRFFDEAVAVGQIHHAGIVKIFDVGFHTDGRAYLVMELLQGQSLAARIAGGHRLALPEALEIARQITSVLGATHAAGITHRDLKPDNIYLVPDVECPLGERVKLLDFGIAKLANGDHAKTMTGTSMGTPPYMAPEMWTDAGTAGAPADVYALGCVMFELVCGRTPFVAATLGEACSQHLAQTPPHARELAPGIPDALDALIARMLAKPAAERPRIADIAEALAALRAGAPVDPARSATLPAAHAAHAAATIEPAPAARARGTQLAGAAVALAAVAAVAVYFGALRGEPTPPPLPAPSPPPAPVLAIAAPDAAVAVAPPPPPDVADGEARGSDGLVLAYRVLARLDGEPEFHAIAPDTELPTGTTVAFALRTTQPAYVFVAQRSAATKELSVLFPDPRIAIANPRPGAAWTRIPADRGYRLDEHDLGTETVYLIAARTPPADLARAITTAGSAAPAAAAPAQRAVESQLVIVANAKRADCGDGSAQHRALTLDDPGCAVKTRGLVLPPDADTTARGVTRVRALADDDVVFVPFTFRHVAAPAKAPPEATPKATPKATP